MADRALRHPDPWTGFTECVFALGELQATDRGLGELLVTVTFEGVERLMQLPATAQRRAREVIRRA